MTLKTRVSKLEAVVWDRPVAGCETCASWPSMLATLAAEAADEPHPWPRDAGEHWACPNCRRCPPVRTTLVELVRAV
jgi:hypothetical protein